MGHALKARVENGRLVIDEPTDLPEGKVVALMLVEDDGLSDEDRARVLEMVDESLDEDEAGQTERLSSVIARLRAK